MISCLFIAYKYIPRAAAKHLLFSLSAVSLVLSILAFLAEKVFFAVGLCSAVFNTFGELLAWPLECGEHVFEWTGGSCWLAFFFLLTGIILPCRVTVTM